MSWYLRLKINSILSYHLLCMKFSRYVLDWTLFASHSNLHLYEGSDRRQDDILYDKRYFVKKFFFFHFSSFSLIRQPPILPGRYHPSTFGRIGLHWRVRDVNVCFPDAHRHLKFLVLEDWTVKQLLLLLLERRWSSRRFSYGYLVTTSPQLSGLPSTAPSFRLGHRLRAFPTPMVWRAVCTRPGNVFTAACWSAITSDSSFV